MITRWRTSLGMSPGKKCELGKCLASLANLSATSFPFHFTWEKDDATRFIARSFTSVTIWPNDARQCESTLMAFVIVSESPSKTTFSSPISNAKEILKCMFFSFFINTVCNHRK